jgi:hypothetical protein
MVEADCELVVDDSDNVNDVEDTVLDLLSVKLPTELMVESVVLETVDVVELDSVVVNESVLLLTVMVELDEMVDLDIGEHVVELDMVVELVTVGAVCGLVLTEKAVEVFVLDTELGLSELGVVTSRCPPTPSLRASMCMSLFLRLLMSAAPASGAIADCGTLRRNATPPEPLQPPPVQTSSSRHTSSRASAGITTGAPESVSRIARLYFNSV